jgi:DNA-binding HxlR family transcriptional regulator
VVGERWALLVVRELLLGPQRFSDLRRALPGASSNMVADRLRELERNDVIQRRTLAPPAASTVYELAERGRALEPILLALGGWGLAYPKPPEPVALSATSVLLFLRGSRQPDASEPATTYRMQFGDGVWTIQVADGEVQIEAGEPRAHDVNVRTDPETLNTLLEDPSALDLAIADGTFRASGDVQAFRKLLGSSLPVSAGAS